MAEATALAAKIQPGLHPDRLIRLMEDAVARCELKLDGLTVLTEAATGAYVVTPILAALAGAKRVYAITGNSRYGSARDATLLTYAVASTRKLADRIEVIQAVGANILQEVDIITNSGHVRPIDTSKIAHLKPSAVIPLMYESWEFRESDVDLSACRARGIRVGATNERHPAVDVFSYLGCMAMKLLLDAGIAVYQAALLLICDNEFEPYIERTLVAAGARVQTYPKVPAEVGCFDAVLVASTPQEGYVLSQQEMERIERSSPGAVIAQFFGDIDRRALECLKLAVWPEIEPPRGHMGILPSAIGPEAIVRLQTGGLKAAEDLLKGKVDRQDGVPVFVHQI
ncbi:MAG TPA: hypothetical protein VEX68_08975 [Bryobacteraceae bacterium]|nr:hypothetical protein [Bryobacteraceae bacterium]